MLSRGQTKRRRKKPFFPFKAFSADSTPECDGCDLEVLALETEVTMSCAGFSSSGEPLDFYFSFSSGQTGGEELYLGEVEGDDEAELTTRWVNNFPRLFGISSVYFRGLPKDRVSAGNFWARPLR